MLLAELHTAGLFFYYADPGSGALLWQLLGSSFVGLLFYSRRLLRRIFSRSHKNLGGVGTRQKMQAAAQTEGVIVAAEVLSELSALLEDSEPAWYTEERRVNVRAALQRLLQY